MSRNRQRRSVAGSSSFSRRWWDHQKQKGGSESCCSEVLGCTLAHSDRDWDWLAAAECEGELSAESAAFRNGFSLLPLLSALFLPLFTCVFFCRQWTHVPSTAVVVCTELFALSVCAFTVRRAVSSTLTLRLSLSLTLVTSHWPQEANVAETKVNRRISSTHFPTSIVVVMVVPMLMMMRMVVVVMAVLLWLLLLLVPDAWSTRFAWLLLNCSRFVCLSSSSASEWLVSTRLIAIVMLPLLMPYCLSLSLSV